MPNDYRSLINGVFICGLPAIGSVLNNENVAVIIDLRAEATLSEMNAELLKG